MARNSNGMAAQIKKMNGLPESARRAKAEDLFSGGGEMSALMREHDWSQTPVGPVAEWPQSLRTALSILLTSGYPMYIAWGQDFVQFYNDAYRPILGSTKHPAALGQRTPECFPEVWDFIGPMFGRVMTEGEATTLTDQLFLLDRNGYLEECYFTFSYSAIRDETGGVGGVFVTCLETTERVLGERRLQALRKLSGAAPAISAALSLDEVLRLVAEQAREIIGAHQAVASLMLDHNWAQAINAISLSDKYAQHRGGSTLPCGPGIYSVVCQTNQPRRMTQAELEAHPAWREGNGTGSGSDLSHQHPSARGWLAAPLLGKDGRNIGLIQLSDKCVGEFTEEDEAILVQLAQLASVAVENARLYHEVQEASRLKDEFLAVVSHELRTPLNAMLGWTRILRGGKVEDSTLGQALKIIERNARVQSQLVEDLLDTARIVSGKLRLEIQPVEMRSVVEAALEIARPAAEAKSMTLNVDYDPQLEPILGDPNRLQQVVWNLLSNAIKFTSEGGRVEVRLNIADSKLSLTVSDTGQGISPEFLPYIFDRFRQADASSSRRYGGLGLGLTLVRHLIELHGGTVSASSSGEGQGATFIVNLPVRAARSEDSAALLVQSSSKDTNSFDRLPSLKGLRVLVVDDEAETRNLLSTVLTRFGARVTAVASAVEALTALFAVPAAERPAILVSDIVMPGEDGYTLIKQVRDMERIGEPPEAPIPAVALTAYARVEDRMRALAAGFQMHLPKPIEPDELIAVVASLTGRWGSRISA